MENKYRLIRGKTTQGWDQDRGHDRSDWSRSRERSSIMGRSRSRCMSRLRRNVGPGVLEWG